MYNSRTADEDQPNGKWQRAVKRARGNQPESRSLEPGEHHQYANSIRKRRSALSIEDTQKQISSYFDPN